jgi:hypothetical protein
VYSFGVVLLEIFTGKRPTDSLFCNGLNIVNFMERNFPDQILDMVDAYLLESSHEQIQKKKIEFPGACWP